MKHSRYDIMIIGGGASGLCTAAMCKTPQNRVLLIEHNDRVGKKILSTGNGKCNLTNLFCRMKEAAGICALEGTDSGDRTTAAKERKGGARLEFSDNPEGIRPYYSSADDGFAETVISRFDAMDAVRFFQSLGMLPLNKNGYIYPRSEQASSVLDLLRFRCEELGVEMLCGYQPIRVEKKDGLFVIDRTYSCDHLVIAAGGKSASKTGSDGTGYELARGFGHTIIPPVPALCSLKCSDPFFKELQGVRTDAKLALFEVTDQGTEGPLMTVKGNLQFNAGGISGIPVFQLSLLASRLLHEGRRLLVKINLLPEYPEEELIRILSAKTENRLLGVLHKKLANVVEKEALRAHPDETEEARAVVLTHTIQKFKVHPTGTAAFEDAQTTLGGVSTEEVNPYTMESRKVSGLYFTGEILDVSGICGGYNLQWAWASAHAAAAALTGK